jgi:hypothetical protein
VLRPRATAWFHPPPFGSANPRPEVSPALGVFVHRQASPCCHGHRVSLQCRQAALCGGWQPLSIETVAASNGVTCEFTHRWSFDIIARPRVAVLMELTIEFGGACGAFPLHAPHAASARAASVHACGACNGRMRHKTRPESEDFSEKNPDFSQAPHAVACAACDCPGRMRRIRYRMRPMRAPHSLNHKLVCNNPRRGVGLMTGLGDGYRVRLCPFLAS